MSSGTLAMKPLQTTKACVLSLAVMPVVGTSFALDFDISRWIVLISAAVMLLTIGIYVAAQTFRSRRDYHLPPPQPSVGDRVSNRLVVLSSAAVLAVYSVGYLRTRAAADRLAARVTRQAAETAAQVVVPAPPPAPRQSSEAPQTDPRPRKNATARSSRASSASGDGDPSSAPAGSKNGIGTAVPVPPPASNNSASNDDQSSANVAASDDKPGAPLKDGRYQGRGSSRHGDIVADVVIEKGQIVYAGIAECLTRYSCSVIKQLPQQVVERQSRDTDVVSGATESTDAFRDGISVALFIARGNK
jgi:uncharacterized protein with FMN-binding domain